MPKQISQLSLALHELALLLDKKLLTLDKTNAIRIAVSETKVNSIAIETIIDTIKSVKTANSISLNTNIKLLEKTFNQSIEKLKKTMAFVMLAKQASQEPEPSFHIHSLIPTLKILNTFYTRKKHNEMNETLFFIKRTSAQLQKTFDSLSKTNFETGIQVLRLISCLDISLKNITSDLCEIQDILELPPQKKAKKSTKV